ncbi:MAG: hypothetical protein PHO57_02855 [Acidithiobacillus sp.]|jgi:hypothetical protein|nr:hypothetical protein [Acidithiobacillus sp.]
MLKVIKTEYVSGLDLDEAAPGDRFVLVEKSRTLYNPAPIKMLHCVVLRVGKRDVVYQEVDGRGGEQRVNKSRTLDKAYLESDPDLEAVRDRKLAVDLNIAARDAAFVIENTVRNYVGRNGLLPNELAQEIVALAKKVEFLGKQSLDEPA